MYIDLTLREAIEKAASFFGVSLLPSRFIGWNQRTIGQLAQYKDQLYWLRVVREESQWVQLDWWTGNEQANLLTFISKPIVLRTYEWNDGNTRFRSELQTYKEGKVVSSTPELRRKPSLSSDWWKSLRTELHQLSQHPTKRVHSSSEKVTSLVSSCWNFSLDPNTIQWSTAHGDLHWANLLTPFTIVDWEAWGNAPAGFDVATLYCHALLIPEMATQMNQAFSYILESPQGQTALLYASARLMRRIERGDYPDLEEPIKQVIKPILKPIFRF